MFQFISLEFHIIPRRTPLHFFKHLTEIKCVLKPQVIGDLIYFLIDIVLMITNAGPGTKTLVLVFHIYNLAFKEWNLGYASAVSMVLFLMVLAITLIQFHYEHVKTAE